MSTSAIIFTAGVAAFSAIVIFAPAPTGPATGIAILTLMCTIGALTRP